MNNQLLLLKKEHIEWFAERFDEEYDFHELIKNKIGGLILEAVDKKAAEITLNFGNQRVSLYIPDEYKDEIYTALDDVIDGDKDYTEAVENVFLVIDQLKDKIKTKDFVKAILDSLLELVKAALLIYLENQQKA